MRLFHLQTKSMCDDDQTWFEEFRRKYECRGCGALDSERRKRPIDAYLSHKPDISAINATHTGIGIVRADFMALFEEEFHRHLLIGRVLDRRGNTIQGFATFHGLKPIPIRSGAESTRRFCDLCGRFVYYPLGDEAYLMRNSLSGQPIYEGDSGDLVLTEDLVMRIDRKKWKGFWAEEISVRDTPLDGIDVFPENYY